MTGVHRTTIQKLLLELGAACSAYQDKAFVNLKCKRVQCDEIWSFVYAKDKNLPDDLKNQSASVLSGHGSLAILTASWCLAGSFQVVMRARLTTSCMIWPDGWQTRVQLTTDGHKPCLSTVEDAFGSDIDFAQLVKIYGNEQQQGEHRYSPAQCMGARKTVISGTPDHRHVFTSHTERQHLTMRMFMRRFTRLTNAFSKKIENHEAAIALHYMYYNFARVHQTLRVTPAMESGISDHVWSLEEIVNLISVKV